MSEYITFSVMINIFNKVNLLKVDLEGKENTWFEEIIE